MRNIRTDLAMEANEIASRSGAAAIDGVETAQENWDGIQIDRVKIQSAAAAETVGKPVGTYITISLDALMRREEDSFGRACRAVARAIRELLPDDKECSFLVAGLGNRAITPDALGPKTTEQVLVTRHLVENVPEHFGTFRKVSAIAPGVLGMTGVETGEIVRGVLDKVHPSGVIAVDALAGRRLSRLVKTIQISDVGIVPGSGVGNARSALNQAELGVPVLAIGVPMVVDGMTLASDILEEMGGVHCEALETLKEPVLVTTKDIDSQVSDVSRVIGYGINLALHEGLSIEDIDLFLS